VATAFASRVLPVPGGPKRRIPEKQAALIPILWISHQWQHTLGTFNSIMH
jgi:hypothetical protein